MKKNHIRFLILFQIFVILFATLGTVTAAGQTPPEFPLLISGDISVNGKEALPGTSIDVKLNDEVLSSTVVKVEGKFGDDFGNKLSIDCATDDYSKLNFYLNGNKLIMDPIDTNKTDSDGFLTLIIDAEISENNAKARVSSGGGGGFFLPDETEAETGSSGEKINDMDGVGNIDFKSLGNEETDSSSGAYAEPIPESEESSNKGLIIPGVVGLLLVSGIILASRSKNS